MENKFSKNLKRIRTDKGLSQEELAKMIDSKQGTISAWEVGRNEPSMADVARLADALGCSQQELIGIEKKQGEITFEDLVVKIGTLNVDELHKVITLATHRMELTMQIEKLENEKKEQEARIADYERQLALLRAESDGVS